MRAQGVDVIGFGAGEPDFNTPDIICDAAIEALRSGYTKYTATPGMPELRSAIAERLWRENGIRAGSGNVVVTCGGKHALFEAFTAIIEPGDEVILLSPFWMTYEDQVHLCGGVPVKVSCEAESGFLPDPERIAKAISPRTRAIVINSPNNPTGAVYPESVLTEIADLALKHGLWVVTDEIYEQLVYDGKHRSVASLNEAIAQQTITIGGCSKTFAMTGWRIGYACAPKVVADAIAAIQDACTSNPTSFAQKGALVAMNLDSAGVSAMREEFHARRDLMAAELAKIGGLRVPSPGGAFYFLLDVRSFLTERLQDDGALVEHLLEHGQVAAIPGGVFGAPGFMRLSYTASQDNIRRGVARIAQTFQSLP